jgi:hypothetical protein
MKSLPSDVDGARRSLRRRRQMAYGTPKHPGGGMSRYKGEESERQKLRYLFSLLARRLY